MVRQVVINLLVCIFLFASIPSVQAMEMTKQPSVSNRSTWLWNPWLLVEDIEGVLGFLSEKKFNRVYLQIDQDISFDVYKQFIESATSKGISVYALGGSPHWVAPGGYKEFDVMWEWLKGYQNSVSPTQQFVGIHLDVEPYLYSGWKKNRPQTISSFQTLILRAKYSALNIQLPLEVDIPFWFDSIWYYNIQFKSGILAEWIIKNTDGVTIMAYRDSATAILYSVKNEINYAKVLQKSIVLGVETEKLEEPESVTFYEEGETFMNKQLAIITNAYRKIDNFNGIAIHHYVSYRMMKK